MSYGNEYKRRVNNKGIQESLRHELLQVYLNNKYLYDMK